MRYAIVCNFTFNNQGRSTSTCYSSDDGVPNYFDGTLRLQFTVTLGPKCLLAGRLYDLSNPPDAWFIRGRTDAEVNIVVGNLQSGRRLHDDAELVTLLQFYEASQPSVDRPEIRSLCSADAL